MILLESFRARYAYLLARHAETSRATPLMEEAESLARQSLDKGNEFPRVRIEVAAIHAVRQQKEPALDWLQQAYDAGWRDSRTLARDPMFEGVREEPRFKELLGRMKRDVAGMRERSSDLHELFDRGRAIEGSPTSAESRESFGAQTTTPPCCGIAKHARRHPSHYGSDWAVPSRNRTRRRDLNCNH